MTEQYASKILAITLHLLIVVVSLFLAYERVGLLPWVGVVLGAIGLALMAVLHGKQALYSVAAIGGLVALGWAGSIYYVYSGWESGEVLDIELRHDVTIRTWVVDSGAEQMVIYDSPPENRALVEAGNPVWVNRGDERYQVDIRALPVELDSEALSDIYALYEKKYAKQSNATNAYYLLIGPRRGSQLFVLYMTRREA